MMKIPKFQNSKINYSYELIILFLLNDNLNIPHIIKLFDQSDLYGRIYCYMCHNHNI